MEVAQKGLAMQLSKILPPFFESLRLLLQAARHIDHHEVIHYLDTQLQRRH